MRLRPRRPRPQTNVTLVAIGLLLAVFIWGCQELTRIPWLRIPWVRVLVGAVSFTVFVFSMLGYLEVL